MKDLRIIFMGTPGFAVGVLKQILESSFSVVAVVTAADKPAGRGRQLRSSEVKVFAEANNIPVLQPTNLKDPDFLRELESYNANLQIVVAFRMLPKVVWQMPEFGTFNLHASLLPQYRGAAPINWAIINREDITGVTTFFIDEKIDTGEIIISKETPIDERETAGSLHDRLMSLGAELVIETIHLIAEGKAKPISQKNTASLKEAPKLTNENTKLDFSKSVEVLDAQVRGLNPYPVAWCYLIYDDEKLKVKIYETTFNVEKTTETIGTLICTKTSIKVVAKDGYLNIKVLQLPGKRKMDATSLLNGYSFHSDAKLA